MGRVDVGLLVVVIKMKLEAGSSSWFSIKKKGLAFYADRRFMSERVLKVYEAAIAPNNILTPTY